MRFPNSLKHTPHVADFFRSHFHVEVQEVGDAVELDEKAAAKIAAGNVLTIQPQFDLRGPLTESATKLASQVDPHLAGYNIKPPSSIHVSAGYGIISELEETTSLLVVQERHLVPQFIERRLIPLMKTKFRADYVTGVKIDANLQQAHFSASKLMLIAEHVGGGDLEAHLKKTRALNGIMPNAVEVLSYVDALTRFPPLFLTLPIPYTGCTWHFQAEAMWKFGSAPANGLSHQFGFALNPLSDSAHVIGMLGLEGMGERLVWRYLKFVVTGVDRLMRHLNDFGTHVTSDGSVDLRRRVQTYCAVHMIFADLLAMASSTTAHNRISYTMSLLDKLANLRVQFASQNPEGNGEDRKSFKAFFSDGQKDALKAAIGKATTSLGYGDLYQQLERVVNECYATIDDGLEKNFGKDNETKLARLWSMRNMRHGTFLNRGQFESLFYEAEGNIPPAIATLPFLLVLGLIADPKGFLSHPN